MRSRVKPILIRKEWLSWATTHLPSLLVLDDNAFEKISIWDCGRRISGKVARCYEHDLVSADDAIDAVDVALKRTGVKRITAIVGDPDAPLLLEFDVADLVPLLERVAHEDDTIRLLAIDLDSSLVINFPTPDIVPPSQDRDSFMVAGTGAHEPLIDVIREQVPGGVEFQGN